MTAKGHFLPAGILSLGRLLSGTFRPVVLSICDRLSAATSRWSPIGTGFDPASELRLVQE
jgi:hypothetical protein